MVYDLGYYFSWGFLLYILNVLYYWTHHSNIIWMHHRCEMQSKKDRLLPSGALWRADSVLITTCALISILGDKEHVTSAMKSGRTLKRYFLEVMVLSTAASQACFLDTESGHPVDIELPLNSSVCQCVLESENTYVVFLCRLFAVFWLFRPDYRWV